MKRFVTFYLCVAAVFMIIFNDIGFSLQNKVIIEDDPISKQATVSAECIPGDTDGNSKVEIFDALLIAQYECDLKSENDILCFSASDTDCNGKTDIFDALRIAEFDAGIVKSLDCDNNDFAPDSAAGKMYRLEIAEGTGIYGSAVPGMFTLAFKDDGTYATTPETENVPPDQGAYTYTRVDGGSGKVTFTSTAMQGAVYTAVFTFTGEGAGTYAAVMTGKDGSEAGTFKGGFQQIDFAPDSAAGKMYRLEIAEGTGIYGSAVPGMFTLAFKDDGTYATTPETENVPPDQGAYTYTRVDGGSGKVTFTSTAMQGAVYTAVFTFTGEGAGTYAAVMTGKDGSEAGTFKGTFQEI